MAIPVIPTPAEIKDRIVADLNNKLNQTTPALPKAFNNVLAGALAGVIVLLYRAITWVYRQIFPQTADDASLRLLGAIVNVFPLSAVFAVIECDVPGDNGYTPPEGTLFRSASSVVYKITSTEVIAGGSATVQMTAQESGESGNLPDGSELSIVSPDPQLTGTATINSTITSGDDAESDDSFRTRVISEYQKRKTGGAPADYEAWGLEAPNFDWISPLDSPTTAGIVQVYGRVDNQTDGIPTGTQLDELELYLTTDPDTGLRTRHPIGPPVETIAITRRVFDVEIFIQNGTTQLESDITDAVIEYIANQQPFNEAINTIRIDTISEGGIADVGNDIANPQGATVTAVTLTDVDTSTAIQSYQLFGGEFGKAGTITFTVVL